MKAGSIWKNTKPGKLYRVLLENEGHWVDAGKLDAVVGHSTCLSTHLAGVRCQLPPGQRLERGGHGEVNFYRLVRERPGEQGELFGGMASTGKAVGYEI